MSKLDAVKVGRELEIYQIWREYKVQINRYSRAVHKSFKKQKEVERFLYDGSEKEWVGDNAINIYVDGSYNESLHLGGYGCVIVKGSRVIEELSGVIKLSEHDTSRNIYGEVRAALEAVEWAIKNKYKKVTLFYDYAGIEYWADGSWSAKRPVSREYAGKIAELKQSIEVEFEKVKAHSGNKYNERADDLAKQVIQQHNTLRRRRPKSLWDYYR